MALISGFRPCTPQYIDQQRRQQAEFEADHPAYVDAYNRLPKFEVFPQHVFDLDTDQFVVHMMAAGANHNTHPSIVLSPKELYADRTMYANQDPAVHASAMGEAHQLSDALHGAPVVLRIDGDTLVPTYLASHRTDHSPWRPARPGGRVERKDGYVVLDKVAVPVRNQRTGFNNSAN